MKIDLKNKLCFFWHGYYFHNKGIWCHDLTNNTEKALTDPKYEKFQVLDIADDGNLICIAGYTPERISECCLVNVV